MAIVLLPGYQITDANGDPVSGGKLYVFEAGTSNPRDVYTDSALTTPHAHPVVADAGGLLPNIYSAEDELKLLVTDASDVTRLEIDNYSTGGIGSGSGGDVDRPVLSKTANYTIQAADRNAIIVMDASGIPGLQGDVTGDAETLGSGFPIGVKNIGVTGNTLIQGTGAQTIDGAANRSLTTQFEFIDLVSRGAAGWFVLASQGASDVSVTVRQADASTDGTLTFENSLGTRQWAIHHINTSHNWGFYRFDSGGLFVDAPMLVDSTNGEVTFANPTYFTGDAFTDGATRAYGTVVRTILTPGSGTWTKPVGLKSLFVRGAGGGRNGENGSTGSGGSSNNGGGSGGSGEKMYLASELSATEAWVVGGANTTTATTFKALSFASATTAASNEAAATGADVNVTGEQEPTDGRGGNTIFGRGGRVGVSGSLNGGAGTAPGTGGGSGFDSGTGGAGQDGVLIIDEYF